MKILNQSGLPVMPLIGRLNYPGHALTFIVKGTFDLVEGQSATLSPEQLEVGPDVVESDEDGVELLRYDSDFCHFKPKADLMLVGVCRTPGGRPADRCIARFSVGQHRHQLVVLGKRLWKNGIFANGATEPEPFRELELSYSHSFGGPGYPANPIGLGYLATGKVGKNDSAQLPRIENPASPIGSPKDHPAPAGFAPLSRTWLPRTQQIGSYDENWIRTRAPWFPEDCDWSFCNAAIPELRVPYLRGGESIELENIHPDTEFFKGQLPDLQPRCFVERFAPSEAPADWEDRPDSARGRFEEVALKLDTVWVDAEARKVVLAWRGNVEVASDEYEDLGTAWIAAERLSEASSDLNDYHRRFLTQVAPAADALELDPARDEVATEAEATEPQTTEPSEAELLDAELDAKMHAELTQLQDGLRAQGIDPENPPRGPEEQKRLDALLAELETDASPDVEDLPWTRQLVEEELQGQKTIQDADLSSLDLSGLDFTEADMTGTRWNGTKLSGTIFRGAKLSACQFDQIDLAKIDFTKADLSNATFRGCGLENADLTGLAAANVVFEGCNLAAAKLDGASLVGANLRAVRAAGISANGANFSRADLGQADLSGASLNAARLESARLEQTRLTRADLTDAILDGAVAIGADLTDAKMDGVTAWKGADFGGAQLKGVQSLESIWDSARLDGANLDGSRFEEASFCKATLKNATLLGANFAGATLRKTDLHGATLRGANFHESSFQYARAHDADFREANLYGADLSDADFTGARLEGAELAGTRLAKKAGAP